jgi:hypothetical protein
MFIVTYFISDADIRTRAFNFREDMEYFLYLHKDEITEVSFKISPPLEV